MRLASMLPAARPQCDSRGSAPEFEMQNLHPDDAGSGPEPTRWPELRRAPEASQVPEMSQMPEVSIGMPVFNGERFLAEAIDSLLQQTFSDFELIISDNASTDRTREICGEYAQRDGRVRYVRQPKNLGATRNWNYVARAARGRFFKWASANDLCERHMLARCVDELRRNPGVVLCYGLTSFIDDDGSPLGEYGHDPEILDESPIRRLIRLRNEMCMNNAQSGLIRRDVLMQTQLDRLYRDGDMVLMAELALRGGYRLVPDVLLYRRMGKESATRFLSEQERALFLDPDRRSCSLDSWRRHADYFTSVLRAPLSFKEKLAAIDFTLRCAFWDRGKLWRELRDVLPQVRRGQGAQGV